VKIGHHTHPRRNIVNDIRWIGENGFDFVDLFLEPESDATHIDTAKISDALGHFGLSAVGHTAWYLPVGSEMRELRENAVDILKRYVLICAELKCALMTVHANWPSGLFNAEEGVNFQTESFQTLCPFAADNGVTIIYESVATPKDNKENIRKILDLNPMLGFHADIGHLNLFGRNPLEYMTLFKDRLDHVHRKARGAGHKNRESGDQRKCAEQFARILQSQRGGPQDERQKKQRDKNAR
jgi:sugar phosphate isomerase/epimerase